MLRVDIEGMRHSVMHAMMDHEGEIQRQINHQVEAVVTSENFAQEIASAIDNVVIRTLKQGVEWALQEALRGDDAINQRVQEIVKGALKGRAY